MRNNTKSEGPKNTPDSQRNRLKILKRRKNKKNKKLLKLKKKFPKSYKSIFFTKKSDIYSLGCILYLLYTHTYYRNTIKYGDTLKSNIFKKIKRFGKNAKEFVNKFQWSKIIENYKKILN